MEFGITYLQLREISDAEERHHNWLIVIYLYLTIHTITFNRICHYRTHLSITAVDWLSGAVPGQTRWRYPTLNWCTDSMSFDHFNGKYLSCRELMLVETGERHRRIKYIIELILLMISAIYRVNQAIRSTASISRSSSKSSLRWSRKHILTSLRVKGRIRVVKWRTKSLKR